MSVMHNQQGAHNKWMALASKALETLHTNATSTQQVIAELSQSQSLLLSRFNDSMDATKDNVEQLSDLITHLSSAIESNISKIGNWTGSSSLAEILKWTPVAGIAWAVSRFSERIAALFVFAFGEQSHLFSTL